MSPILLLIVLTILSYLGVWIIRRYAEKRQLLDHPNERSSHSMPTPRGGGLAIVLIVIGTGLWVVSTWVEPGRNQADLTRNVVFSACGIV